MEDAIRKLIARSLNHHRERERDGAKALSQSPQRERERKREREREGRDEGVFGHTVFVFVGWAQAGSTNE